MSAASRSPKSSPNSARARASRALTKKRRAKAADGNGAAHRTGRVALSGVYARRMGDTAPGYADDAATARDRAVALDARAARYFRGRGNLSAAVAAVIALRGGTAKPVSRAAALPRHRGHRNAVHHRRGWFGGGRQVDCVPRAASTAGALAECAEGRSRHHRRIPVSQCRARPRRLDGEEGLSGKLRCASTVALSLRYQGRPPARSRADLFAS